MPLSIIEKPPCSVSYMELVQQLADEFKAPHLSDEDGTYPTILVLPMGDSKEKCWVIWSRWQAVVGYPGWERYKIIRAAYMLAYGSYEQLLYAEGYTLEEAKAVGVRLPGGPMERPVDHAGEV